MCTPACSCLSLYTCTYWTLQKEILWAQFNRAEIIPTSPLKENNHLLRITRFFLQTSQPWTLSTNLFLLQAALQVYPWIQSSGGSWGQVSHTVGDMALPKSKFWGVGGPHAVPLLHSKRSSSSQQQAAVLIHLAALSLLSQTVYHFI